MVAIVGIGVRRVEYIRLQLAVTVPVTLMALIGRPQREVAVGDPQQRRLGTVFGITIGRIGGVTDRDLDTENGVSLAISPLVLSS